MAGKCLRENFYAKDRSNPDISRTIEVDKLLWCVLLVFGK